MRSTLLDAVSSHQFWMMLGKPGNIVHEYKIEGKSFREGCIKGILRIGSTVQEADLIKIPGDM